ncbi:MAG: deoxyguanosinetriphosphate triphosphohydrolase [Alphaproteobacteria bacterium]
MSEEAYNYCALPLAAYACRPDQSRGRVYAEEESRHRTGFQRDRDRIIHASAFRRLKYKTQVFVYHEGDHYRTRLTHTLEVAQVTRTLARALMINEDLAETIALAHDLGHTPFAHVGEIYLAKCMEPYGGFDHNDQSLRVLTTLERRYPKWNGLNLTWETLEGVAKHNGPIKGPPHVAIRALQNQIDLQLDSYASLEAQVAALSDDIAYNNHDVEDGLRAGLFTMKELDDLSLLGESVRNVRAKYGDDLEERYLVSETVRDMIGAMVEDVLTETRRVLRELKPASSDDIRMAGYQLVSFSPDMKHKVDELRDFLYERMYRSPSVKRIWLKVERIVGDLFTAFCNDPELLPRTWQARAEEEGITDKSALARVVADYIAGMTDRFALREHERMFDLYGDLR